MKLKCPKCNKVLISMGEGASVTVSGQVNNLELMKKVMKCSICKVSPVLVDE